MPVAVFKPVTGIEEEGATWLRTKHEEEGGG
jgi:hypothetical protein